MNIDKTAVRVTIWFSIFFNIQQRNHNFGFKKRVDTRTSVNTFEDHHVI